MIERQLHNLSPTNLRIVLISSIVLMLILGGVLFWFFRGLLVSFASDVRLASVEAQVSSSDIEKLRGVEKRLQEEAVAVTRAKNIVAESKEYQYQDQIIKDLTAYAEKAGVKVTSITFNAATAGPGATAPNPSQSGGVPGINSISATVDLKSPVTFVQIMNFVHSIEENLTKMQLSGLTISKATAVATDKDVSVTPITVEVYTK